MEKKKQERKVVHLELNGQHEYFGSISQLYKKYDAEILGKSYYQVKNTLAAKSIIETSRSIIRIGWLQTSLRSTEEDEK